MTRDERIFTPRDIKNAVYQEIRAAYEAGEIAMREKAAREIESGNYCRAIDHAQHYCDCRPMAAAIRALAISGAEESKKEKA
jgi:hypothetical protein